MRRFELSDGSSNKFWEVSVAGKVMTVRFGRIGTDGQTKEKAFANPAAAEKEADKLVAEKTGKGYRAVSATKKPAASKQPAPPKQSVKAKTPAAKATAAPGALPQCSRAIRDDLAAKHWPKGIGFDDAGSELFSLGWPAMRRLTDEKADAAKTASKVLEAIDPVRVVDWPRAAAARYLHGFAAMVRTSRKDPSVPSALARDEAPHPALAQEILRASVGTTAHYSFHWQDAFFLLECFLGPELMAEQALVALEGIDAKNWADDNPNNRALELPFALECFLLRADDARLNADAAKRLRALVDKRKKRTLLANRLAMTLEGTPAVRKYLGDFLYNIGFLTHDTAYFKEYLTDEYPTWRLSPQHLYLGGPEVLSLVDLASIRRDPAWKQRERVVTFGIINHPAVADMMRVMVGSKAAGGLPEKWLAEHGAAAPAPPNARKLTQKDVEREGRVLIKKLIGQVKKIRGDKKAEKKAWVDAVHALIELRAAAGDPCPSELLGHMLGLDGWTGDDEAAFEQLAATAEESDRWFSYIDEACDS